MIIELFLDGVLNLVTTLTAWIDIPDMPTEAIDMLETVFGYLEAGAGILANYTPLPLLMTLFGVVLAVDVGVMVYHFVLWILKKIPMAGIS